ESVTLKCSYETSSEYVSLYWYRQYPNRALQYLLYKDARRWSDSHTADNRFESTTTSSSTDLTVTVSLADTALYYCALRVG
uniref:T-cell receptor alpha/delta variable 23.3.8 n=1 Tax=Astyanax mexicanus TaxID=7994 RepID=W5LU61_ASTMX